MKTEMREIVDEKTKKLSEKAYLFAWIDAQILAMQTMPMFNFDQLSLKILECKHIFLHQWDIENSLQWQCDWNAKQKKNG